MLIWTTADLENKLGDFQRTLTIIDRTPHYKAERLTKMRLCRDPSPFSIPINGNPTVEVSITHR